MDQTDRLLEMWWCHSHGSVRLRCGGANWLRRDVGNMSVLSREGEPMESHKQAFAPGFAHVQTWRNIYASKHLNFSQFTINKVKVKTE